MLGFGKYGFGDRGVIVLNDWIGDVSTNWSSARQYLDDQNFTWAFADLRGYGQSLGQRGQFSIAEATADVLAIAGSLGWQRFSVVGHSMSSLVALHLAQHHRDAIERAVVLTPPPLRGFGADEATIAALRDAAYGDDAKRSSLLKFMWGDRLSERWIRFKMENWRAGSDPHAVAEYVFMFARDGLPDPDAEIPLPLLAITGEQDAEVMRMDAVTAALRPISAEALVVPLASSGHYPMQEAPPMLAALLERFLLGREMGASC